MAVLYFCSCESSGLERLPLKLCLIHVQCSSHQHCNLNLFQNTRWKDKASQTVRNAADASSYNSYKQIATGLFFYAEINLNGGITGKRWIINPSPPFLYAQWNNIFTKSSCRAVLENREDGLSWNKGNTLTYKTKPKAQNLRRQERQGECRRKEKYLVLEKVLKGNKLEKKWKIGWLRKRQLLRWNLSRMACTAYDQHLGTGYVLCFKPPIKV